MHTHPTPFATEVRATAFVARGHDHGVNLTYFGRDARPVASAFATLEDIDLHARDLLALVAAARRTDDQRPLGNAPRVRSALMRGLSVDEPREATATLHAAPPLPDAPRNIPRMTEETAREMSRAHFSGFKAHLPTQGYLQALHDLDLIADAKHGCEK